MSSCQHCPGPGILISRISCTVLKKKKKGKYLLHFTARLFWNWFWSVKWMKTHYTRKSSASYIILVFLKRKNDYTRMPSLTKIDQPKWPSIYCVAHLKHCEEMQVLPADMFPNAKHVQISVSAWTLCFAIIYYLKWWWHDSLWAVKLIATAVEAPDCLYGMM